jgi:hypothetical protein
MSSVSVFRHDFGELQLTGEFISEASERWPGQRVKRMPFWCDPEMRVLHVEPKWHEAVFPALQRMVLEAESAGVRVKQVKSLSALNYSGQA